MIEKDYKKYCEKVQISLHGGTIDGIKYDHLIGPTWDVERVLWIGYQKNINNPACLLTSLYKQAIKQILSFL